MFVLAEQLIAILNGVLLLLVFFLLLQGPARKFPFVLTYVGWECFANFALAFANRILTGTEGSRIYARFYWINEVLVDLLRFILVVVLTSTVTAQGPQRTAIGRILAGVAAVTIVLPFLLYHPAFGVFPNGQFFAKTSQLLNFGAAIMNLVLWGALVASRQRDPLILAVSAGLGVVVTGAAFAYGLRHFIEPGPFRVMPDVLLMLTQTAGWTIWCRGFWAAKAASARANTDPQLF